MRAHIFNTCLVWAQWLFPIRERSPNHLAHPALTVHEVPPAAFSGVHALLCTSFPSYQPVSNPYFCADLLPYLVMTSSI